MRLISKTFAPLYFLMGVLLMCAHNVSAVEYIVKLKSDLTGYDFNAFNASDYSVAKVTDTIPGLRMIKISVPDQKSDVVQAMEHIYATFDAEYVVENIMLHAFSETSDPRRAEQWALDTVQAAEAWGISEGSHEVVVAVIDTGIDVSHEDLADNMWLNPNEVAGNGVDDDNNGYVDDINGWDFKGSDKSPQDETSAQNPGHGTHCAGIIGAVCDNEVGVCGMSPKVSLMALRFLGSDGSGDLFAAVKSVDYAIENGAHIISASWGASVPESGAKPVIDAVKKADDAGIIFIAAAGNDGHSNDTNSTYPANAQTQNMISVAASDRNDQKPSWSNYGRKVDLASPGAEILSTIPEDDYKELNGTSMATPLVSGLVALMKSIDIDLSGAAARSILQTSGDDVSIETASNRRVNAYKALKAVSDRALTVVPATATIKPGEEFDFTAWGGEAPYTFSSLNPEIATVDESGHLVAVKEGSVSVAVTDAQNNTAQSVSVEISEAPAGGGSECPFQDPFMCAIMCIIQPDLEWCDGSGGLPGLPGLPPGLPFPFDS